MWYIGDEKDVNMGFAMNRDPASNCAEEITQTWEWYDWEFTGGWVMDDTAKFTCVFRN